MYNKVKFQYSNFINKIKSYIRNSIKNYNKLDKKLFKYWVITFYFIYNNRK